MRKIFTFFAFACFSLAGNWTHARESTVSVQLTVPDGGWKVRIDRVYQTPTHLLAVSKLERNPGLAIQVISQAKDSVRLRPRNFPCDISSLGKLGIGPTKSLLLFFPTRRNFPNPSPGQNSFFKPKPSLRRKPRTRLTTSWSTRRSFSQMGKPRREKIFEHSPSVIVKNWRHPPRIYLKS